MRNDPVLRWANDARTRIVHQGDLEIHSTAKATLHWDWAGKEAHEYLVDPIKTTEEIASEIVSNMKPTKKLGKDAILTVERRWVSKDMPAHEVLDALAHSFNFMNDLIRDAHRQAGIEEPCALKSPEVTQHEVESILADQNTWPRLLIAKGTRTVYVKLATGKSGSIKMATAEFDKTDIINAAKKYDISNEYPQKYAEAESLKEKCELLLELAKKMMKKDGSLANVALLSKSGKIILPYSVDADDRAGKFVIWENIAKLVRQTSADCVLVAGETWFTTIDTNSVPLPLDYYPNRQEAVTVYAASEDGDEFHIASEIIRDGDLIIFGDNLEIESIHANFFEAVRQVWKDKKK
jgi:hypothetical protein